MLRKYLVLHFFSSFKGEAQQLIGGSQQITSGGACEPYIASEPFALALEPCTVQVLLTQTIQIKVSNNARLSSFLDIKADQYFVLLITTYTKLHLQNRTRKQHGRQQTYFKMM